MKIIGIDPGYDKFGVAIVEKRENKDFLVFSDCLRTSAKLPFSERLHEIGERLAELIKRHGPDALAIEKLFFTTNQKTAMGVSEIKGMTTFIALENKLSFYEYTPLQIKNAVAGYGKAEKSQVSKMVPLLLSNWKEKAGNKIEDDEYDAIAVALTCMASIKILG